MGEERILRIERILTATPEAVFDAWTKPDLLVQWWGPEGFTATIDAMDLRVGGRWRTTMRSPEGSEHIVAGVYRTIDRPSRLVMTWAWDEDGRPGHETEVDVSLEPTEGGTRLRLQQQEFATVESHDTHNGGWTSSLNKLERMFP